MVVLYTFQNIGQENLDWFRAEGESGDKLGVHLAVTRTQPYSSARAHLYIEQPSFLANQWLSSPQA